MWAEGFRANKVLVEHFSQKKATLVNIAKGCLKQNNMEASSVWIGSVSEVNRGGGQEM